MIDLLYCGNDKVFDGMMISLLSIIKYTKQPLHVYVLTMDLRDVNEKYIPISQEMITYLEEMLREKNQDSRVTLLDITDIFRKDMSKSSNLTTGYTPYTLARLYADVLPDFPDRILYLDTDTMAKENIEPIFNIDISSYEIAGVIDYLGKWFIDTSYINAGILYLNMEKIRETGLFAKARKMCAEKKMCFPDQTSINRLVQHKLFLPVKYNEQRKLRKNTVIQHFCKSIRWLPFFHTINVKPWEIDRIHKKYHLYCYDDILNEYTQRITKLREE